MATQKPSDFVDVQLTPAGAAVAPVAIANGHFHYQFAPGVAVRVLTSEWRILLSRIQTGGSALLEVAPETSAAAATQSTGVPTAAAPIPTPAAAKAPAPAPVNEKKSQDEAQLAALEQQEQALKARIAQEE